MKSNLILFLLFYFNLNTLFAQNFERVENTIGLGVLEEKFVDIIVVVDAPADIQDLHPRPRHSQSPSVNSGFRAGGRGARKEARRPRAGGVQHILCRGERAPELGHGALPEGAPGGGVPGA